MALKAFNSEGGFGLDSGNVIIDSNGNVVANNLTVSGTSDLGQISNITITGGSNGQAIVTDGTGNLSFTSISGTSNLAAPMPFYIPSANSYTVSENFQGLFYQPIEIDGSFEVDGILIDVSDSGNGGGGGGNGTPGGTNTQVQYNDTGVFGGNSTFTFNEATGVLAVPNVSVTGNIIPSVSNTYNLGNANYRFNNLYLAGNTIILGNATIAANATTLILTNPNGDVLEIDPAGVDTIGNVTALGNVVSQSNISAVGNITGGNISTGGTLSATGNISGGNIATAGDLAVTGNGSFGNLSTSGTLNAVANTNLLANLYVGSTSRFVGQITVGNPNADTKSLVYPNGYASFNKLDVVAAGSQSGNLSAANLSVSGIMSVNTINSIGNLNTTGTITAQNIVANANITANNANLGNLVTANFFSGDGYLLSNITVAGGTSILNGNSNVAVAPNANATFTINGNANVVTVTETNTFFSTNIVANANVVASVIKQNNVQITLDGTGTWIAFDASLGNVLEVHDNFIRVNGYANFSSYANIAGNANVGGKLIVTGNAESANFVTAGRVDATGNITGGNLVTTGNISAGNISGGNLVSANYLQGDGFLISNLTVGAGTAITNGNSNVQVAPNANVTITAEGNANVVTVTGNSVILDKQLLGTNANFTVANITTINASSLSLTNALTVNAGITGNTLTAKNLTINQDVANGFAGSASIANNLGVGNLLTAPTANVGTINASGSILTPSLTANNTVSANTVSSSITLSTSGNLSVSGNANLNVLTVTSNITSGNISGGNLVSANFFNGDGYLLTNLTIPAGTSLINGTSNLFVDGSGNIRLSVAGSSNLLVTSAAGTNIVGNLSVSANANTGNLGTGRILATGNVTTSELISNGNISGTNLNATGNLAVTGTANIGANIIALNANLGNAVSANYFIGDGYLLTNLTIPAGTAILNGNSNVLVTANSDVNITVAGTPNVVKVTSSNLIVTGNLVATAFANGNSNVSIVGNSAINFSSGGVANVFKLTDTGANANVKINALQGLEVTGNSNVGNLGASGIITAAGEVSGGSLDTGGSLRVGGNANIGNLTVVGSFSSLGNITGGNLVTNGIANVNELYVGSTGANINGYTKINANLDVTGNINVTGNLNYSNVTDLVVGDPLIFIGANNAGDTYDLGLVAEYNNGAVGIHTGIARNEVNGYWTFFDGVVNQPTTVIDWANATYPTVKLGNLITTGNANVTGNVSANLFLGNFSGNISGNLTGIGSNTQILFNDSNIANANAGFTFNKVSAQVNVTGNIVGGNLVTAGSLSVTGNSNVGNLGTGGLIVATGNVTGGNLVTGGALSVTGNANIGNIGAAAGVFTSNVTAGNVYANSGTIGASLLTGTLTTNAQPNITSVGTITSLTVTGNTLSGNVYANSGTIGANLLTANLVTGTLTTSAQPNITSLGTLSSLSVTGNVTAGNLTGILANGTSNVSIPALNGNVLISAAGAANVLVITSTGANVTGTFNATGNLTVGAKSNLGPASNVIITGGTANYVLSTDGSGNLSWVAQSGGGGGSANIAIYDDGTLLTNTVTSLDFVGAGVTANANGNAVTVTISGGGGGGGTAGYLTRTYTGNGVQTAFTVTSGCTANSVIVTENGVVQTPITDYTVASTTLTFTTAPANNTAIQIRELAIGGATGGGSDQCFQVNSLDITANYAIPAGKSAMSVGPININSGVVITVPSGSKWVVL